MLCLGLLSGFCTRARRYFCKSFSGCLSHDPVGLQGGFACYFPYISGLRQEVQWVGFPESFRKRPPAG
jgi:hypothetical protein